MGEVIFNDEDIDLACVCQSGDGAPMLLRKPGALLVMEAVRDFCWGGGERGLACLWANWLGITNSSSRHHGFGGSGRPCSMS